MGTKVTAPTRPESRAPRAAVPEDLADVALIDARTAAAAGCMSVSWWTAEVAAGRAPQSAMREVRCTRWRLTDVREFWRQRAARPVSTAAGAQAKRASDACQAKRQAAKLAQVGA